MSVAASILICAPSGAADDALAKGFRHPPDSARPWVYWFPLDGNISSNGITADLEAMKRVGIGGVLYMETSQGTPPGPAKFGGPLWRELFKHICSEANRLGLQVNMNNDAGWCGSGGPWITPELSMQRIVSTETNVLGPLRFDAVLAQPQATANFYRDIAVFAFPTPASNYIIPRIRGKSAETKEEIPLRANFPKPPSNAVIPRVQIANLTGKLGQDGRLAWEVPEGKWTLLRVGHTSTGKDNHPAPVDGRGLESDKFSKHATEVHFAGLMGKLIDDSKKHVGETKTLVATHIDSWETGSQNWTPRFRGEFQRLRGYDPLPWLPVMRGHVVDGLEVSERFLWDVRMTVNDLLMENYAGYFRELAHRNGMRLSIEAYDGSPTDDLTYAGRADEPMAEFWSWAKFGAAYSCTEMSSAAHVYGKRILGAEAFTATDAEKWLGHPANVKDLGDWAFCEGINRFVFHRYALQPWTKPDRAPGVSMGPWGLHYERTQTWWEQSRAWHEYLARCQFLLQQGLFVADLCFLAPERSPQRFSSPVKSGHDRPGYNFDGCPPEVVLTRMKVKNGRIVLPDGMSYRMLVLPQVETMTPRLLRKIKELVSDGAAVAGPPPLKSPSLSDYPKCDDEVKELAAELWGTGEAPEELTERRYRKGRIFWGGELRPKQIVGSDAESPFGAAKWVWHREGNPAASAPPGRRHFRRAIVLDPEASVASARLAITADNSFECWINGRLAGGGDNFNRAYSFNIAPFLKPGTNLIAVAAVNATDSPNPAGLIASTVIKYSDGHTLEVPTDASWQSAASASGNWMAEATASSGWAPAMELGPLGMAPWGEVESSPAAFDPIPDLNILCRLLAKLGVPPDFSSETKNSPEGLRYIHKTVGATDVYFLANKNPQVEETLCSFRVSGRRPELWWPDTGRMERIAAYDMADGMTRVPIRFEPSGSVFVVFRGGAKAEEDRIVSVTRNGDPVLDIRSTNFHEAQGGARILSSPDFIGSKDSRARRESRPTGEQVRGPKVGGKSLVAPQVSGAIELARDNSGVLRARVSQPGVYVFKSANGKSGELAVKALPEPLEISGAWRVRFASGWGAPELVTFEKLISWSEHSDAGVRYFSGTAAYSKTFNMPPALVARGRQLFLDLGKVAVMAEVKLNGKDLGIVWKPPFRVEITDACKPGENTLEVKVVNLWVNRMIGDEQLAEDSDRNANGTLKSWPKWFEEGKSSPTGRYTFTSWRLWKKDSPLQESGLLGPVKIEVSEQRTLRLGR
ncbi:MAG: hypothetical protein HY735_08270 [Verrucomicrobia bacterium]|nr:hypothetical protein [Verrucomicrobiota bacterium]